MMVRKRGNSRIYFDQFSQFSTEINELFPHGGICDKIAV